MSALALDMHKRATQNDRAAKISEVYWKDGLIPIPVKHRLSKTASLWKIHRRDWDKNLDNSEWIIKPHDYSPHHQERVKLSTDELYKLIFLQPREPTEREQQQMVNRMEAELTEFMRKPHESTFPDDTHDKCQETLGQVLEFLESRYNTVYTQLGRNMNAKRNKKPKSPKAKPKAKPKSSSSFKIGKKRCPPGCVKRKTSRKVSRKRRSVKRKTSRKRRSVKRKASRKRRSRKRSRKKVIGGKMRTIYKSKNPIPYDEDWAKGFVTHIGPGGGGGVNNYTGAKKVPTRRILDARKKLIDKIYFLHDQLVALDSSLVKDMFAVEIINPTEWRDPPQYMDRDDLKHYVKIMKADVKSEKQKLKKSHKFSAGEMIELPETRNYIEVYYCATCPDPIIEKRPILGYGKMLTRNEATLINMKPLFRTLSGHSNYCPVCKSQEVIVKAEKLKFSSGKKRVGKRARGKYHKRDKRDKSRRRKKDKSRRRKKNKKDKLSRELLKANKKKSRKHKFRNGDGENPETFMGCWRKHVGFGPGNVVTAKNDAALRHCVWTANALRYAQQQLGKPRVEPHQRGAPPGKSSKR